ncbi:MAG: methyltransferase [Acidimicrobiaceae bacterium]|nr:methyltransferase [Acidimicrobiaceae bacterium]
MAETPREARAVQPGTAGGAYRPLSDAEMNQILGASLTLLEDIGMGQATPEFVDLVVSAGGSLDQDSRLHFPEDVVRSAIDSAAKEFTLHGFSPEYDVHIGGNRVHFSTAGAAVLMLDHDTSDFRPSVLQDLYEIGRVVGALEHLHIYVRTVVARDLESSRELDLNTAYAVLRSTTKPIGTSFFQPEHVHDVAQMFNIALTGDPDADEFRNRPFCIANNTFVVPPLRFAEDSALCLAEQVRVGMPINLLSAGQAGATSPATLAGSLSQALAECLAGLTCVNLLSPGHPCTMGMWPFVSDLRTGAMSGGSGEEALLNAAAAQLINWIGLPSGVAAGMADSKLPDQQAGHEKGTTVTLAAQAGANVVFESAGMLASLLACSLETLVIDNDLLGAVTRTIRGIEIDDETLSVEVIRDVVQGAGHFLGHQQTLDVMQTEYVYPAVGDRLSPEDWADAGSLDVRQRARQRVIDILAQPSPSHIDEHADQLIREMFPIHLDKT